MGFDMKAVMDKMKAPCPEPFLDNFDSAIYKMKQRLRRKQFITDLAHTLAGQVCDMIEDAEGWHGEHRREKMEKEGY